jgi:hypothetical protein
MKNPDTMRDDPPCIDDSYIAEDNLRARRRRRWFDGIMIAAAIVFLLAILVLFR